jgi:hypothetical protein
MIIQLELNPETNELILPLSDDLCAQLGWVVGTELDWIDNNDGTYILKEKKNAASEEQRPNSDHPMSTVQLSKSPDGSI